MIVVNQKQIKNIEDVREFFNELYFKNVNFSPEDSFLLYQHFDTKVRLFSESEAERLDKLLDKCTEVCGNISPTKIYEVASEEFEKWEKNADKEGRYMLN